jgi:hypothetical protein
LDRSESRTYALERANEALGHKPSKDCRTEIFIVLIALTTTLVMLKTC